MGVAITWSGRGYNLDWAWLLHQVYVCVQSCGRGCYAGVSGDITWSVGVAFVVQPAPGYGLAAEQGVTVQVVAEFLQEAQDVGDAADRGQGQSALLLLEIGCRVQGSRFKSQEKTGSIKALDRSELFWINTLVKLEVQSSHQHTFSSSIEFRTDFNVTEIHDQYTKQL